MRSASASSLQQRRQSRRRQCAPSLLLLQLLLLVTVVLLPLPVHGFLRPASTVSTSLATSVTKTTSNSNVVLNSQKTTKNNDNNSVPHPPSSKPNKKLFTPKPPPADDSGLYFMENEDEEINNKEQQQPELEYQLKWSDFTEASLRDELTMRGLTVSSTDTKEDLVQRLQDDDALSPSLVQGRVAARQFQEWTTTWLWTADMQKGVSPKAIQGAALAAAVLGATKGVATAGIGSALAAYTAIRPGATSDAVRFLGTLAYDAADAGIKLAQKFNVANATLAAVTQAADAVADAVAEQEAIEKASDVSIPYDAAAKLAYETASDKSMGYEAFKKQYEADAVEMVKSKQKQPQQKQQPVDVSIPYDAAAKLAYQAASDQSMPFETFKKQYEADAVAFVTAKQIQKKQAAAVVDVSIPYDAAAKLAYQTSRDKSNMSYETFKKQYEAQAVEMVKSKHLAAQQAIKEERQQAEEERRLAQQAAEEEERRLAQQAAEEERRKAEEAAEEEEVRRIAAEAAELATKLDQEAEAARKAEQAQHEAERLAEQARIAEEEAQRADQEEERLAQEVERVKREQEAMTAALEAEQALVEEMLAAEMGPADQAVLDAENKRMAEEEEDDGDGEEEVVWEAAEALVDSVSSPSAADDDDDDEEDMDIEALARAAREAVEAFEKAEEVQEEAKTSQREEWSSQMEGQGDADDDADDDDELWDDESADLEALAKAAREAVALFDESDLDDTFEETSDDEEEEEEEEDVNDYDDEEEEEEEEVFETAEESNQTDWSQFTVAELKTELQSRGLPANGRKADLVARLEVSDRGELTDDFAVVSEAPSEQPLMNWSKLTVAQLRGELSSRGLPTSGKKAELVATLEALAGAEEHADDNEDDDEDIDLEEISRAAREAVQRFSLDEEPSDEALLEIDAEVDEVMADAASGSLWDIEEAVEKPDYSSMTVAELKLELKSRGLAVSGRKADLIKRLEQ